jgi:hypothetical protein
MNPDAKAVLDAVASAPRVVRIILKRVYGELKAYPDNSTATVLCGIAGGTATLTPRVLRGAVELGYDIQADASNVDRKEATEKWGVGIGAVQS